MPLKASALSNLGSYALHALLLGLGLGAIALSRPDLATTAETVKTRYDLYSLPPAEYLPMVSFGYRSAMADVIWAHILVQHGLHAMEKRPFDYLDQYFNAVITLDPRFREPYRLADSLLTFQSNNPHPEQTARAARAIQEKGLEQFPYDGQLWMYYGEFLAYVAPQSLSDEQEKQAWRTHGAQAIVHAGELGGRDENLLWHSLSGANILSRAGQQEAMLRFFERMYASTEDEDLRAFIQQKIEQLSQGKVESQALQLTHAFDRLWKRDLPSVSRSTYRLVGPPLSPWACAGRPTSDSCPSDWNHWAQKTLQSHPLP